LGNGNYTVPSGKKLYMTSLKAHNLGANYLLQLNNNIFDLGGSNNPVIAQSGDIISVDNYSPNDSYSQVTVFGYLADDDYFSDCGGGGSGSTSSSSNIQSNGLYLLPTTNNQSPYDYLSGELYVFNINYPTINHIVIPIGKVFKTNYYNINGCNQFSVYRGNEIIPNIPINNLELMVLVENDSIVFDYGNNGNPSFFLTGQLFDINPLVTPFCFHLNDGETYTVPSGKTAVMQTLDGGCVYVEFISGSINLQNQIAGSLKQYFPIWPENTQITISPYGGCSPGTIIALGYGWYVDN